MFTKTNAVPWSIVEDEALRDEVRHYTLLEICKRHNRASIDVFGRMQILGLAIVQKE